MELSISKNKDTPGFLYDPVRKKYVENTPEELIRQLLIKEMIEKLGYPIALLAVEKEISSLPHLQLGASKKIPRRRADIIVYSYQKGMLLPLLMVECKSVPLTSKWAGQVIGYNAFVQAPYVALANGEQILTGSFDHQAGMFRFASGLPSYALLNF